VWPKFVDGCKVITINDTVTIAVSGPFFHVPLDRIFRTGAIVGAGDKVFTGPTAVTPVAPGDQEWATKVSDTLAIQVTPSGSSTQAGKT